MSLKYLDMVESVWDHGIVPNLNIGLLEKGLLSRGSSTPGNAYHLCEIWEKLEVYGGRICSVTCEFEVLLAGDHERG